MFTELLTAATIALLTATTPAPEPPPVPVIQTPLLKPALVKNVSVPTSTKLRISRAAVTSTPAPPPPPEPVVEEELPEYLLASYTRSERVAGVRTGVRTEHVVRTEPRGAGDRVARPVVGARDAAGDGAEKVSGWRAGVVAGAHAGVGSPYVWGGNTPSGWDCSGFVKYVYAKQGINIARGTSAIRGSGQFVRTGSPKPGDLVFQNGGGHVGIYLGDGQMIGAQNPAVGTLVHSVSRNPLYGYYTLRGQ